MKARCDYAAGRRVVRSLYLQRSMVAIRFSPASQSTQGPFLCTGFSMSHTSGEKIWPSYTRSKHLNLGRRSRRRHLTNRFEDYFRCWVMARWLPSYLGHCIYSSLLFLPRNPLKTSALMDRLQLLHTGILALVIYGKADLKHISVMILMIC